MNFIITLGVYYFKYCYYEVYNIILSKIQIKYLTNFLSFYCAQYTIYSFNSKQIVVLPTIRFKALKINKIIFYFCEYLTKVVFFFITYIYILFLSNYVKLYYKRRKLSDQFHVTFSQCGVMMEWDKS